MTPKRVWTVQYWFDPRVPRCQWCESPALPAQYVTSQDGTACRYHRHQLVAAVEQRLWVGGCRRIRAAVDAVLAASDICSTQAVSTGWLDNGHEPGTAWRS